MGGKVDAAKAALRGPATPPVQPGIGATTAAALGEPQGPSLGDVAKGMYGYVGDALNKGVNDVLPNDSNLHTAKDVAASMYDPNFQKKMLNIGVAGVTAPEEAGVGLVRRGINAAKGLFKKGAGADDSLISGLKNAMATPKAASVGTDAGTLRGSVSRPEAQAQATAKAQAEMGGRGVPPISEPVQPGTAVARPDIANPQPGGRVFDNTGAGTIPGETTAAGGIPGNQAGEALRPTAVAPGKGLGFGAKAAILGTAAGVGADTMLPSTGATPGTAATSSGGNGLNKSTMSGTIGNGQPGNTDQTMQAGGVTLRGGQVVSPQAAIDGTGIPVSGTGAFQRTGGKAVAVGTPDGGTGVAGSGLRDQTAQPSIVPFSPGATGAQPPQTLFGHDINANAENLDARRQYARQIAMARAGWAIKKDQSDLATAQQTRDTTQRGVNDSILKTQLEGENDPNRPTFERDTLGKGDNQKTIDSYNNAEMQRRKADIQYTLNAMKDPQTGKSAGKSYANASPADMQALGTLAKFKSNVMAARSGWDQSLRDYIGQPRGDSKNLLGYKPVSAVRSSLPSFGQEGGYIIHFANGNTAPVFAANGGGFNMFGPNKPRDLDLDQFIAPLIQKAQGK